jgi:hypothetical protein
MMRENPYGKTLTCPRHSFAARIRGAAVRTALPVSSRVERWRNKKLTSKNCFKQ